MHIHILNIAGSMTAPLAVELQKHHHLITGSDQLKIYPPFSTLLHQYHIPINQTPINKDIDLVIVGSAYKNISRTADEFKQIQKLNIPFVSATKYIAQNVAQTNSILVAGAYAKTTISALVVWILHQANLNPSYMVAGRLINRIPSLRITPSLWSVIEADESINGLDTKAKFLYYKAKYVILTSVNWEHRESYSTQAKNEQAFIQLLKNIPINGLLVYNPHDPKIKKLLQFCRARTVPYNRSAKIITQLIGQHNHENTLAAYTLCHELGIDLKTIKSSIKSFRGISRRLQILSKTNHITVIDDFAQSGPRIESAVRAIRNNYPSSRIFVYFEPHASFLQDKSSLIGLNLAFSDAHQIILGRLKFNPQQSKNKRVIAQDYLQALGPRTKYIPLDSEIHHHFVGHLQPNDVLIHLSSGGLNGLNNLKKIIRSLSLHVQIHH